MSDTLSETATRIINTGLQAAQATTPSDALSAADNAVAHAVSDLSLSAATRGGSLMPLLEIVQLYVREKLTSKIS